MQRASRQNGNYRFIAWSICENLNFGRILKLGECWGHGITSNEHAMELDRA